MLKESCVYIRIVKFYMCILAKIILNYVQLLTCYNYLCNLCDVRNSKRRGYEEY